MDQVTHRQVVGLEPGEVFARLAALGDLQIVTRKGGIVHEQFGAFPMVERAGTAMACAGPGHSTALDIASVGRVVVNRLGGNTASPQPRVDFLDRDDAILVCILGEPNSPAFQAVIDGFTLVPLPGFELAGAPDAQPVAEDHASVLPIAAAGRSRRPVTVEFQQPGIRASWRGVVEGFQLGPRNINVIQPDFHLHLKGGAIAAWDRRETEGGVVEHHACDDRGQALGLVLKGEAAAFA